MSTSDPVSAVVTALQETVQENWREAQAEKARLNTPISYWCKWFPGLKHSPKQFYAAVEQKVQECQIPNLQPSTIMLKQGGILSANRLYLRLSREKLVFEICAAPFGTGFFVSSRLFDRRREAKWYHFLLLFIIWNMLTGLAYYLLGRTWGIVICGGIVALIWSLMRLAQADVLGWLSRELPEAPLLGRIYERLFNPDTFFRQDTNACYRTAVHDVVMSAIDEMATQHGIRRLTEEERQPTLAGDRR